MPGKIAFLDEDTRPHFFQQFFFFDNVPGPLNQDEQGFQVLRRERDGLAVAEQDPLNSVEAVGTESV
jgi:hypothetical protein